MSVSDDLHIGSASELFQALEGAEPMVVLGALRAVAGDPAIALEYGAHDGRDIVDVLVGLSHNATGTMTGAAVAVALAAFGDERAVAELCRLWDATDDDDTLRAVADAARARPTRAAIATLRPALFAADRLRVMLAAPALAASGDLSTGERLRVALATRSVEPPPLDGETVDLWASEMDGPFAAEAAAAADGALSTEGHAPMAAAWDRLGPGARMWVAARSEEVAARALEGDDPAVRDAALAAVAGRGDGATWRTQLAALWRSGEAGVRLAVIRAGLRGADWRGALSDPESDTRVRVAALRCLARDEGQGAAAEIADYLGDADWRMRAAATDGLRSLGAAGVEAARSYLSDSRNPVRVAAAQVLIAAGAWNEVEEALLDVDS